jgi:hypothetical protein
MRITARDISIFLKRSIFVVEWNLGDLLVEATIDYCFSYYLSYYYFKFHVTIISYYYLNVKFKFQCNNNDYSLIIQIASFPY